MERRGDGRGKGPFGWVKKGDVGRVKPGLNDEKREKRKMQYVARRREETVCSSRRAAKDEPTRERVKGGIDKRGNEADSDVFRFRRHGFSTKECRRGDA